MDRTVPGSSAIELAPPITAPVSEDLAESSTRGLEAASLTDLDLVKASDYLATIPTRLEREKIRHQTKKRSNTWHVPRSRKRRNQKFCSITRSGSRIYHAHTVKAQRTKDLLRLPGVRDRLRALHIRRPEFRESNTDARLVLKETAWPSDVKYITTNDVPEGISFADIGDGDTCSCIGDCFMDSCPNATLAIYCTPDCCGLRGVCSNAPRAHPAVKLYDTCRVGLGAYTTQFLELGDVIGEYTGRMCAYSAVVEGQPAQALKHNSGFTMLLNTKSSKGKFVYIEALTCGSAMRFLSHSCKPNAVFVEMQNRASVKVLVVMTESVGAGSQLTVNYGNDLWFKCVCDSCWLDPELDQA